MTNKKGQKIYGNSLVFSDNNSNNDSIIISDRKEFFTDKSLCLLSNQSYNPQISKILELIYDLYQQFNYNSVIFESCIQYIINEIPCPDYEKFEVCLENEQNQISLFSEPLYQFQPYCSVIIK